MPESFLSLYAHKGPLFMGGGHFPFMMCWCQPTVCPDCNLPHVHQKFQDGATGPSDVPIQELLFEADDDDTAAAA